MATLMVMVMMAVIVAMLMGVLLLPMLVIVTIMTMTHRLMFMLMVMLLIGMTKHFVFTSFIRAFWLPQLFYCNHFPCFFQEALVRSKSFLKGPLPVFSPLTRKTPTPLAGWLAAGVILFISLGFIYGFFHHHHDFSFHLDCPICILAGQTPVITLQTDCPSPEQTPQPFFQAAPNLPGDQSFLTLTFPRGPPA
jgi:hypothetical protein